MFSVQDYSTLSDTSTGLPLAEIFRQATQSTGGAFGLVFMLWIALYPCMIGSQLSMLLHAIPSEIFFPVVLNQYGPQQAQGECSGLSLEMAVSPYPKCKLFFSTHWAGGNPCSVFMLTNCSWAQVHPKLNSPLNAQLCVTVIIGLLGCIYLGSSTAFNAMMSSSV